MFRRSMYVFLPLLFLILANNPTARSAGVDPHLTEAGSSAIFMRSAFAHGYRHGYDEGYHLGNIDINMGRHPHTKLSQFHDLSSHYTAAFGPRKSFEAGFEDGIKAGYADGFVGRMFRAVENLRSIALDLSQNPAASDPTNIYFDQGFSAGYGHGLDHAQKEDPEAERVDIHFIGCPQFHPTKQKDVAAEGSFCDGYRRGFVLGHADGVVLTPNAATLASK